MRPCTCNPRDHSPIEPGALQCYRCGGERQPTPVAAQRCPRCLGVLSANEIIGGICWNCGTIVDRRTA